MIPATIESLQKHLEDHKLQAKLQPETQQLYIVFRQADQEFALFIRLYEGEEMLQLITFFPIQLPPERVNAIARMLHFLNKEIDLPGFGMDESIGLIFHRIMIPLFQPKKIDTDMLDSYLEAIPTLCSQFFPIIAGTIGSNQPFEELMKQVQKTIEEANKEE